jgi:uncharacterized membrane protein
MERPPLSTIQRITAGAHVLLALAFVAVGFIDAGGGDGWSDLARVAVALIAGIYLLATATVTAAARYAVSASAARIGLIVLGPPVLIAIAIVLIRG